LDLKQSNSQFKRSQVLKLTASMKSQTASLDFMHYFKRAEFDAFIIPLLKILEPLQLRDTQVF